MKNARKQTGITLIALVITIIILLILAGVSVSMLAGQNGIFGKAADSKVQNDIGTAKDECVLLVSNVVAEYYEEVYSKNYTGAGAVDADLTKKIAEELNGKEISNVQVTATNEGEVTLRHKEAGTTLTGTIENGRILWSNELTVTEGSGGQGGGSQDNPVDNPVDDPQDDPPVVLAAGFYDSGDNLIKSWSELVDSNGTYKMDVSTDYDSSYQTVTTSPYYVLNNYEELASVTKIVFDDSVTKIGGRTFRGCTQITSIDLPDSLTTIGDRAFNELSITSLNIPNSVLTIGSYAFYNCSSLTSVDFSNSLTSIGTMAFEGCTGLTSIDLPDALTSIGDYAFEGCTGLTSIDLPDALTSVGYCVFANCTGVTSIDLPDVLTSIGDFAFAGCTGLTSIDLSDALTSIGTDAFKNCTGLTSIKLPKSLTRINRYAFRGCTNLTSVKFNTTSGWKRTQEEKYVGNSIYSFSTTIPDSSTAATYLTDTYKDYYFWRSE